MDKFEVPDGVETSLGQIVPLSFGYQDGVVEADISAAAVEMRARKGLTELYPDVSFDENDYEYEWSRDIGDVTVKCFGNRDGEATKTVWMRSWHTAPAGTTITVCPWKTWTHWWKKSNRGMTK